MAPLNHIARCSEGANHYGIAPQFVLRISAHDVIETYAAPHSNAGSTYEL